MREERMLFLPRLRFAEKSVSQFYVFCWRSFHQALQYSAAEPTSGVSREVL